MPPRTARETALESDAVAWARALPRGWIVSKLNNPTGIQDRCFWVPGGRPKLIEFKRKGGKTSKKREAQQKWYREKLRDDGYETYQCATWEEFMEAMGVGDDGEVGRGLRGAVDERQELPATRRRKAWLPAKGLRCERAVDAARRRM